MKNRIYKLFILVVVISMLIPTQVFAQPQAATGDVEIVLLHTNDFHGNLDLSGSNPGAAKLATAVNTVRAAKGIDNVVLMDAGDEMQGTLLSNYYHGESTIATFNHIGYQAATFGNHEFDWGQTVLGDRLTQADYPFLAANLVAGDCSATNWTKPTIGTTTVEPYTIIEAGPTDSKVKIGIIGITTTETPYITKPESSAGLCFKDPFDSVSHYYAEVDAASDVIVILSHLGFTDAGGGYGFPVYGDKTLADKLNKASKPVNLIIGGHSHTDPSFPANGVPATVGSTIVATAHYNGRKLGQATITYNTTSHAVSIAWTFIDVTTATADVPTQTIINSFKTDEYTNTINTVIGYTNVSLPRDSNAESLMGDFIQDAIYNDLNEDADAENDVDLVFNNPGGIRADVACAAPAQTPPCALTYGTMYSILPFGNQTLVGEMTGAQIQELLNQSANLFKGMLQLTGVRFKFYRYVQNTNTYAWGAYDIEIRDRGTDIWLPLDLTKVYKVATNDFLAPGGQDGFIPFKYFANYTAYGDMLDGVNRYVAAEYGTTATAFNGALDGRITRSGTDAPDSGEIIPLTILHHNDSHGRLAPTTYPGYTQLATIIKQERTYNPTRTLLLSAGDNLQGDSMMYYFRTAPLGYGVDGAPLDAELRMNPFIKVMNAMDYDAMTLGNHEFNFGSEFFTSTLSQATFPILQANIADSGVYGLADVPVEPYVEKTVGSEGIKVAILGIGNHRIPNYELPSNIPGLTFSNPIDTAADLAPDLKAANDVVIALTHIGFTTIAGSLEVDNNVDTYLATHVNDIDAIVGGHSHTDPSKQTSYSGSYKYLPTILANPDDKPVIVGQAERYNDFLGEIILGLRAKSGGGYEVVAETGKYVKVGYPGTSSATPEDQEIKDIVAPYLAVQNAYNATVVGQTEAPIDTMKAFTQETNGANLQADASKWVLESHDINVDFHLSGAMTNKLIATGATPSSPITLTVSDMFAAMPYENSLVVLQMTGSELKAVLERAYRNYYYYKYVPGYGGYSYYTTCMLDTSSNAKIYYMDTYPQLPNGNNVLALVVDGKPINFQDTTHPFNVSTVNYLAAGSCNFNNSGVSLWPLQNIVADTQYYVRDAVINYTMDQEVINPIIEGRLSFDFFKIILPWITR